MTNASKSRGSRWERRFVDWLTTRGFPFAERRVTEGARDRGDVSGIPRNWVIELKSCKTVDLAGWMDEAAKEAANAGGVTPTPAPVTGTRAAP